MAKTPTDQESPRLARFTGRSGQEYGFERVTQDDYWISLLHGSPGIILFVKQSPEGLAIIGSPHETKTLGGWLETLVQSMKQPWPDGANALYIRINRDDQARRTEFDDLLRR